MALKIKYSKEVLKAKKLSKPILALESTIIAHGMQYPKNLDFARKAEALCREGGVIPATTAIINGKIHVGLETEELEIIASPGKIEKISMRELGVALAMKSTGATTVSSTIYISNLCKINVFATGGIGGIHRGVNNSFDMSQDLLALSRTPGIVVSSGAKSILDIPKTVEALEFLGITTLGYKTKTFPSFYSRASNANTIQKVDSIDKIVEVFNNNLSLDMKSSILITNPVPKKHELPKDKIQKIINTALKDRKKTAVSGKDITPFLLKSIVKQTNGKALRTNIELALNNVKLALMITKKVSKK